MQPITISRKIAAKDDLVILPRKEYEALLAIKQAVTFTPTVAQKKALARAERNFENKKTLSYHEFIKELGFTN